MIRNTLTARWIILSFLLTVLWTSCGRKVEVTEYNIIPEPEYIVSKGRSYTLSSSTRLCFANLGRNTPTAKYIANSLRRMHVRPAFVGSPESDCILFSLNDTVNPELGNEGYLLQVKPDGIFVSANTEAGLLYAFETFVQMLPPDILSTSYAHITLPECTILDRPQYAWRCSQLDVTRHFFTVKEIKRHLDLMVAYKLNKFVWHLADDQGWRVEIDPYPALTDIGAWRVDRRDYPWGSAPAARPGEEATYGGFYSPADIAEVVEYASSRNIEVIPSIDIPGRCSAILAAYPSLSCDRRVRTVATGPCWPHDATLCVGNDSTLHFLYNVLDCIASLFPSEYIHIGCSPCSTEPWEQCPRCQALKRKLNLGSETELQGWLVNQVAEHLSRKGKRIIGWDDMLDCGTVPADAVVAVTKGDSVATIASLLAQGIVVADPDYCSFDTYQADTMHHPAALPRQLTLHHAYQFNPMPRNLPATGHKQVWGGLCTLWTDHIHTYDQAEYQLLPRLCAFAECLWTRPEHKDWQHFRHKIEQHKTKFATSGHKYCPGSFKPLVTRTPHADRLLVTIDTEVADCCIYYTLDGSDPTPESSVYVEPLLVSRGTLLRTLTFYHGQQQEGIYSYKLTTN